MFFARQRLRFIGADGSMGLVHGAVYDVKLTVRNNWIWVIWTPRPPYPTSGEPHCSCPYETTQSFANNWATLGKGEA